MTQAKTWFLLGLMSLASVAAAQTPQATGDSEKAVAALENQWLKSQQTNNPDMAAPLFADKFVNTTADGTVMNKAQTLADAKGTKYSSAVYENVQVTVFGNTAIATGLFKGKGTDAAGKALDERDRWTDTWAKMPDGKWLCVATQATNVK